MIPKTLAAVTVLLAAGVVTAQGPERIFSRPTLPPREALDRLNLKVAWRTYAGTNSSRDALKTVRLAGNDIFVLSRSGILTCLDAATGQTRWRSTTGPAFPAITEIGCNSGMVFGVNGNLVTAFDRTNGRVLWQWDMPGSSLSTAPLADDPVPARKEPGHLFLSGSNNQLSVYQLPYLGTGADAKPKAEPQPSDGRPVPPLGKPVVIPEQDRSVMAHLPSLYGGSGGQQGAVGPLSSAREASRGSGGDVAPLLLYEYSCEGRLDTPPVMGRDGLLFAGGNGTIFSVARRVGKELFESFRTEGTIMTPPAAHGDMAYVVGGDNVVYAVKISSPTGRRYWRFTKGAPIRYRPAVTDDSVFVTVERGGLWRLDRETGLDYWGNLEADRFLACNAKFVYALDRSGRLLILDRKRGTRLSGYPTRDFNFPVINDFTDRIYFAANDGMIVCLHDKDYVLPLAMRTGEADLVQLGRETVPPGDAGEKTAPAMRQKAPAPGGVKLEGMKPRDMPKEGVEAGKP